MFPNLFVFSSMMTSRTSVESALQLVSRVERRPSLVTLDPSLFQDGLAKNDMLIISGEPSVGKSLLIYKLIASCILPKAYAGISIGGLEAEVVLIETDHNNSIRKLVEILQQSLAKCTVIGGGFHLRIFFVKKNQGSSGGA